MNCPCRHAILDPIYGIITGCTLPVQKRPCFDPDVEAESRRESAASMRPDRADERGEW